MFEVVLSNRFRKDLKLAAKRGLRLDELNAIVEQLAAGQTLPERNRDHALTGDYIGFRECHIRPDWVLIYEVREAELVPLSSFSCSVPVRIPICLISRFKAAPPRGCFLFCPATTGLGDRSASWANMA